MCHLNGARDFGVEKLENAVTCVGRPEEVDGKLKAFRALRSGKGRWGETPCRRLGLAKACIGLFQGYYETGESEDKVPRYE